MTSILITDGLVISNRGVKKADIRIVNGLITEIADSLPPSAEDQIVRAEGMWVGPGFVDLHTHLREPGGEAAETIESGARAAIVGGYTALVAMPNTEPAIDNVAIASFVLAAGARTLSLIHI